MMFERQQFVGLAIVAAAFFWQSSANAQPGVGREGGLVPLAAAGGLVGLAGPPAVQKDLGLEGDAAEKVKKIVAAFRQEMQTANEDAGIGIGAFAGVGSLSDDERQARMREVNGKRAVIMNKLNDKFLPQLREVLTAQQVERLQEIGVQINGSQGLTSPEMGKTLDLTGEQQDKIAALNQEYGLKQRELTRPGGDGLQATAAKRADLVKEREARVVELLSQLQQERYARLKGKPFDMTQLQGPFGGSGPRGRQP